VPTNNLFYSQAVIIMADAEDATNTRPTRARTRTRRFADVPTDMPAREWRDDPNAEPAPEQADDDDDSQAMSQSSEDAEDPKYLDHDPIDEEEDDEDEEEKKERRTITFLLYRRDGTLKESQDAGDDFGEARHLFYDFRLQMVSEPGHVELLVDHRVVLTTARGGMFLSRTPPTGGRKPLMIGAIYALAHRTVKKFGDEINVAKFGGVERLGDLAYALRPLREVVCQSKIFPFERELKDETTGEKKSGFIVQDGPWPGDAEPDPKWLFVIAEEPVEEEESEEESS